MEQQRFEVCNLKQSCQQAEDALTQGMDKLQLMVAEIVAAGQLGEQNYAPQIGIAMEKLEADLVLFVNQVILYSEFLYVYMACKYYSCLYSSIHPNCTC